VSQAVHASQYTPAAGSSVASGSGASGSGADAPADDAPAAEFARIEPQPESFSFSEVASDAGKTFECQIDWLPAFRPGATCRFDTVPGRSDGLTFQLPDAAATAVRVRTLVDASAVPGSSFTVHSLLMQGAAPAVDPPVRQPVPSHILPPKPVAEVETTLAAQGWRLGSAAPNGDCAPLSILAGHELSAQEAALPSAATTERVLHVRTSAVNLIAGTATLGGIPSATVRDQEGLPKASGAAQRFFKSWKKAGHWRSTKGGASSGFLLGCAVHVQRQVAVLALNDAGNFEDPARVYGMRNGIELRRTPGRGGDPETIPCYFPVEITILLEQLRSNPSAISLLKYNGTNHFDP
jgi:hypothetical protein